MREPTIMQLCLSDSWGGLEMSALNYARLLNSQGLNSFCLTNESSPLASNTSGTGVIAKVIPSGSSWWSKVRSVRNAILENNVQTVFVHRLKDLWVLWPALWRLTNVRAIGFAHMLLKVTKRDPWHALLYSRLKNLVAFTGVQRDLLLPRLPVSKDRYVIAYPGVDSHRFNPSKRSQQLRIELGASDSDCLVGVIGRFDRQKGQLEFVQALDILKKQGLDFKAVLVGASTIGEDQGGYENEVKSFVAKNGLSENVKFVGFTKDISPLLASLDVFALPSYEETFGLVVLEAMASGVAVVATNAGGPPEIIGNSQALFEPRDAKSLAQTLSHYIQSANERTKLASQLRTRAVERFSEEGFLRTLVSLAQ